MISIKELEIIIENEEVLDLLIYAKCIMADMATHETMQQFQYSKNNIHHVLKMTKELIEEKKKTKTTTTTFSHSHDEEEFLTKRAN